MSTTKADDVERRSETGTADVKDVGAGVTLRAAMYAPRERDASER